MLQLATGYVAQLGTGVPQIVRRKLSSTNFGYSSCNRCFLWSLKGNVGENRWL